MAKLQTVSIKNFKGFQENKNSVSFAIPDGTRSGLTVLVGPNNSGKSTIFDSFLKLREGAKIGSAERREPNRAEISITDDEGKMKLLTNLRNGSQIAITGESRVQANTFEFISSRRHWQHTFGGTQNYESYNNNRFQTARSYEVDGQLGALLAAINANDEQKQRFNELLKRLVPHFSNWGIDTDQNDADYVKYTTDGGAVHHAGLLGDGIMSLFRIAAVIVSTNAEKILLFDEPELSLHPQAQKALAQVISDLAKSKQIVVATHSPHFIRWEDIKNGAKAVRLQKKRDKVCEIYALGDLESYVGLLSMVDDWQKPQLMDAVAKEIFFAQNVVFVEGQEDKGLIEKYVRQTNLTLNFDVFGYGVGGAGNIPAMLKISKDLGVSAGAIFDGNKASEYEICNKAFPEACIKLLGAADIRDKYKCDASGKETSELQKEGVFDRSGNIKSSAERGFKKLLDDLIAHFETA